MTTKIYHIANLGCANCAAKMEKKMNDLPQVQVAVLTFTTRQLRITAEEPDALLDTLQKIVSGIEPDAKIVERDAGHEHHEHQDCCGHDHHEQDHDQHEQDHDHGQQGLLPLLVGAGLFAVGLALDRLGIPWVGLLAYVLSYLVLGLPVLTAAWQNMVKGHVFDENFLMSIATLGAFAIREYPEAVGVMLFYRVGEYFEEKAVARSRKQIMEAVDLRPEEVMLAYGHTIPAEQAKVGDILLVRPGDRIPLDGVVLTGESRIDTAPITGESVPVRATAGDLLLSGCVNLSGQLTMQVEKPLSQSMVTRILEAVESAAAGKPRVDRFITRFARIYTPIVVAVAVFTAIVPSVITGNWGYWVYTALSFLVMSCPCALVLSVPLAFFSGIGVGSRKGILFKGGASIEALADIKQVAMDKTGTVTKGDFSVQQVVGPEGLLELCAACERNSTHPIAQSIVAAARTELTAEAMEEIPGQGIRAVLDGKTVLCGNEKLMTGIDLPEVREAGTKVYVAVDGQYQGYILIADTVKADGAEAVARLKKLGITTAMLTGDGESTARVVAQATGIQKVYAKLLPQQKLAVLEDLRKERGSVLFVGDGINDAPVLAGADVGAAMGSGADAAIEAADVVYLTSAVQAIPDSVAIARRTKQIAWQNVVFALAVKTGVVALGLLGYANMWLAVFADSGVAMLCVLNSIRQLYKK